MLALVPLLNSSPDAAWLYVLFVLVQVPPCMWIGISVFPSGCLGVYVGIHGYGKEREFAYACEFVCNSVYQSASMWVYKGVYVRVSDCVSGEESASLCVCISVCVC